MKSPEQFEYKSSSPKKKGKGEIDPGRRDSLKIIGGAVIAMIGGGAIRKISDMGTAEEETVIYPNSEIVKKQPEPERKPEQEGEQSEPEGEIEPDMDYAKSLSDILDFDKEGPIQLTPEKMRAVRAYWKQRHESDPNLLSSLKYAYREIGCWIKHLEDEFSKNGVPEQFAYLAIPESYWNFKKMVSPAKAVGYYQIMPDTARNMGLQIGTVIDERMHPIKGAGLCARYLKEWHDKAKGNRSDDNEEYWFLSLAAYNGSFAQKYINNCKKNGEKASYAEHLKTIEGRLNKIKDDLMQNNLSHTVGKGETPSKIAKKYGISFKEFQRVNVLKGIRLNVGQILVIPTAHLSREAKKKVFAIKISGFVENLNYPEKFYAIYELIRDPAFKRKYLNQQKAKIDLAPPYKVQQDSGVLSPIPHVIKKGETLSILSRKYGVKIRKIAEDNKGININNLKPGDTISIPDTKGKIRKKEAINLITEAQKHRLPVSEMGFKNQHVRNWQKPLPNGTELWV